MYNLLSPNVLNILDTLDREDKKNNPPFLSYKVIQYPKDFTEDLVLEISTNLEKGIGYTIQVYDIDTLSFKDIQNPEKDTKIINKSYQIQGNNFRVSIPFNADAQVNATKDKEGSVVECYLGISPKNSEMKYSKTFYVNTSKKPQANNQSEVKVIKPKLNINREQQAYFMSAVMVETSNGKSTAYDIAWIYFNLIQDTKGGFESAMQLSNAYKKRSTNYTMKAYLCYFGVGKEFWKDTGNNQAPWDDDTVYNYVHGGGFLKPEVSNALENMKKFCKEKIFCEKPMTLYSGWYGEGSADDMNTAMSYDPIWGMARQYYWMQKRKEVSEILIKRLWDFDHTYFIYDKNKIATFFKRYPSKLPDEQDIRKVVLFDDKGSHIFLHHNGIITRKNVYKYDEYGGAIEIEQ